MSKSLLSGGRSYTLPQMLSASDERYTEEHELSGWTKGDAALAEMRDASGEWLIKYADSHAFERQPPAH